MRKLIILSLLSFLILNFFMAFSIETAVAYQDGDLFICDFSQYADGTVNITEAIEGNIWFNITTTSDRWEVDTMGSYGKRYRYVYTGSHGTNVHQINWNFFYNTSNLSWSTTSNWGASESSINYVFYSNSYQLLRLRYDIAATDKVRIWINDESAKDFTEEKYFLDHLFRFHFNNNTISYKIASSTASMEVWDSLSGYSTVTNATTNISTGFVTTLDESIDNITVNAGGVLTEAWEIDYDSFGDVLFDTTDYTSFGLTAGTPYGCGEIVRNAIGSQESGITIRQVALAVPSNIDLSDIGISLMCNGYSFGLYDNYYIHDVEGITRYIIVWENLNKIFYANNLLFEFLGMRNSGTPTFAFLTSYQTDVDGDGDNQYKYWTGTTPNNYNGLYDGTFTEPHDIVYKVWYNTTAVGDEYGDVSGYDIIGNLYSDHFGTCIHHNVIEGIYDKKVNHKIYAVDLLVTEGHYANMINYYNEERPDLFRVNINGEEDSSVNYFIPFSSDAYILRWMFDTPVQIDNTTINASFYTPASYLGSGMTNSWCVMIRDGDINSDGLIEYKYDDGIATFNNGIYDGIPVNNYDLVYRLYYEPLYVAPKDYPDSITTDKTTYQQYENVKIQGTIADESTPYSVRVYYNTGGAGWTEFNEYGFPKNNVDSNTFTYYLKPIYTGQWNATLIKDTTIVDVAWFNVTSFNAEYVILTTPNPSRLGEKVDIYALYNFSDTYDVRLKVSTAWKTYYFVIVTKQQLKLVGSINFQDEGIYYLTMQRRYNWSYPWSDIIEEIHVVKSRGYDNWLSVKHSIHALTVPQTIIYQHNFLNNLDLKLVINDALTTYNIYKKSSGTVNYTCPKEGSYKVAMVLLEPDGSYIWIVDNVTWVCQEITEYEPAPVLPRVEPIYGYILGTIITAVFAMLPMLMAFSFHRNPTNVPPLVYAFTTAIGLILSVGFGFYPMWVLFVFIAVGIIVTAISYLVGKRSE